MFSNDFCIVSLSSSPWEHPHWVSRQSLMYELSRFCPVLYANGRQDIRTVASIDNLKRSKKISSAPFEKPENLVVQPSSFIFPKIYRFKTIDRMISNLYGRYLRKRCRQLSKGKIVAYVWEPGQMEMLEGIDPDLVVYHPYDKFDALAINEKDRTRVSHQEKQLSTHADIVIAPSQRIAESFSRPDIFVLNNAVFIPDNKTDSPQDSSPFERITHPKIGYIGTISDKLDFKILYGIARETKFSVILMGPQRKGAWQDSDEVKKMRQLPNCHFFPAVRSDEVLDYMSQLDLGIMPYNLNGHAGFCESPLKMYQYWFCGLPVISTPLPNLGAYSGFVCAADDVSGWIEQIENELKKDSPQLKDKRKALARENSWKNRADQIYTLLSGHEKMV